MKVNECQVVLELIVIIDAIELHCLIGGGVKRLFDEVCGRILLLLLRVGLLEQGIGELWLVCEIRVYGLIEEEIMELEYVALSLL
jgi:hypothetical protein